MESIIYFRKNTVSPPLGPQGSSAFPCFQPWHFWMTGESFQCIDKGKAFGLPVHWAGLLYSLFLSPIHQLPCEPWFFWPQKPLSSVCPMTCPLWHWSLTRSNLLPITSSSFSLCLAKGSALPVLLLYFSDFPHHLQVFSHLCVCFMKVHFPYGETEIQAGPR